MLWFLILYTPSTIAVEAKPPVDFQEVFKSTTQLYGDSFTYPQGKAEMRLYKVDVDAGAKIPLHFHPSPLTGHIQEG